MEFEHVDKVVLKRNLHGLCFGLKLLDKIVNEEFNVGRSFAQWGKLYAEG